MASLKYDEKNGSWRLRWRADGRQLQRRFASEAEARTYMGQAVFPPPRRGRRTRTRAEVVNHLAANFEVDGSGCWIWTGKLTDEGYARMTWNPIGTLIPGAHRVVLHAIGQPVPSDLVVDHLCRNRDCINPDHLDVVVQRENIMRSPIAPGALNAAKTHCPQGHAYSPENTYVYTFKTRKTTTRICRTCSREYHRAYSARKRAERQAVAS